MARRRGTATRAGVVPTRRGTVPAGAVAAVATVFFAGYAAPGDRDEHARREPKPGEKKSAMRGGCRDAADFDTLAYHLPATSRILTAYEMHPEAFRDRRLRIPESGNGIPDVLDEAERGRTRLLTGR